MRRFRIPASRDRLRFTPPVVLLLAAVLLAAPGCGDDDSPGPNLPPQVSFIQRPETGARIGESTIIRWTGSDPDGTIDRYETSLDSETEFTAVEDTVAILTFTKADGTDSNPQPHVFRVRAVDDRGLAGPAAAASFQVAVFNRPPEIQFVLQPPSEGYTGPEVDLAWTGSDADGTVDFFEFVLDDTTGEWTTTTDTTLTIDFSSGQPQFGPDRFRPLNVVKEYTFYLRSVDNDGKRSLTIRTGFFSGAANVGPTITLLDAPAPPPFVVEKEATWSWEAVDPDGAILRVQYAVDLTSPAQWRRWDDDSITIEFTRADGTDENPVDHTFFLRAQDDDSTYSAVITRDFRVGVPNQPPTVSFTRMPQPGATVSYFFTYEWDGRDDIGIAHYLYAVDDTTGAVGPGWVQTTARSAAVPFSAFDVDPGTCNATGCSAFGQHRFFLKAVDVRGLESRTLSSDIRVFNRTPVTRITAPAADGEGNVTGGTSLDLAWSVTDLVQFGPGTASTLVREVDDFAAYPTGEDAVAGQDTAWVERGNVQAAALTLESGKRYIVAVRTRDQALAYDHAYVYGQNVIKVTVP